MDTISINDIGTDLQITITESGVAVDISQSQSRTIILTKPDGSVVEKTAAFISDGTDGKIHCILLASDIDQLGIWSYKGRVTFSSTQVYNSINPKEFNVI